MNIGAAIAVIAVCVAVDVLAVAAIVSMFVSLGKKGDERRTMIVHRACTSTLGIGLIYLILASLAKILVVFVLNEAAGINALSTLAILAIVYHIQVWRYRRKFGD